MIHLGSIAIRGDASVLEAIEIGERSGARVIFSHFNPQGATNYGRAEVGARMIEEARESIRSEKDMALKAIKDQVAELSILVSGKLLKKNLEGDKAQENLIKDYIKDLKIN